MDKPPKPYKVYRALLYLYPKSHRKTYGQQMIQTLDDLLSDSHTARGRTVVWLRVIWEMPINIIEENIHNTGVISVNKLTKISNRRLVYAALAVLIAGSYAIMAVIWQKQHTEIGSLNTQLRTLNDNQHATSGGAYKAVTIIPSEQAVYLPLARLKLADTTITEGLVYDYEPAHTIPGIQREFPAKLSISTHDLTNNNFSTTRQFDCSEVAYADFVTPSYPVNPKYISNGSVKLADGRTMNIYYAPTIPGCEQTWEALTINPKAISDTLKVAVSY